VKHKSDFAVANIGQTVGIKFADIFKLYFGNKNGKALEERYYFQAFNGIYEKTFKANGLR